MRGAVCVLILFLCLSGIKGNGCPLSSSELTRNATDDWQYLRSPTYNSTYTNNLNCEWTIQSLVSQWKIILMIVDMDLEEAGGRCIDYIDVLDGGGLIGRYCNRSDVPVISRGRFLRVRFTSDHSIVMRGFRLMYRLIPSAYNVEVNQTCLATGILLEAEDNPQFISSPNYPTRYTRNTDCVWKIQASPPGHVVKIVVIESNLEFSPSCCADYVAVYDGFELNVGQFYKWCGNETPTIYSRGLSLSLHFHSHWSHQQRRFIISFQEIPASAVPTTVLPTPTCDAARLNFEADSGLQYILSPNYPSRYPQNANCMWKIQAPTYGHVVKIVVIDSSLESSSTCSYDYVAAYDGYGVNGTQLDKWCGSETPTVYSSGQYLTLNFHSDGSTQRRGFKISFQEVPGFQTCSASGVRMEAGIQPRYIPSPNFPLTYPANKNCVWKIRAPTPGHVVQIVVLESSLEISASCSHDYVAAFDGYGMNGKLLDKWCGSETPTVYSTGPFLTLNFRSDLSIQFRGFQISFQEISASERPLQTCSAAGVSVEAEQWPRYILSPNYPLSYPGNTDCRWTIHAPTPGYVVKIVVLDSQMLSAAACFLDYVAAYDAMGTGSRLDKWCGSETPTVYSSGSYLTLDFHSDGSSQYRGFNISFQEVPDSKRPASLSASAIVGILFGVCAFIAVCALCSWCCLRKRRQSTAAALRTSWSAGSTPSSPHSTFSTAGNQVFFTRTSYSPGTVEMSTDPFAPPPYPGPAQHGMSSSHPAAQASRPPHPTTHTSGGPDWSRQQSLPSEPPPPYSLASQYQVQPGKQTGETTPGHVSAPEVPGGAAAPGSGHPAPGGSVNRGFVPDQL